MPVHLPSGVISTRQFSARNWSSTVILYMYNGSCMDVVEMIFHLLNIVGMFVREDILEVWLDFLEMISIWNWRYY